MVAAALFGVAAHFANVLPDLDDDNATGIRGLPHRIGARATAVTAAALLACAATVILLAPGAGRGVWTLIGFAATVVIATIAVRIAYRNPASPLFFRAIILIAGIVLVAFAVSGVNV